MYSTTLLNLSTYSEDLAYFHAEFHMYECGSYTQLNPHELNSANVS